MIVTESDSPTPKIGTIHPICALDFCNNKSRAQKEMADTSLIQWSEGLVRGPSGRSMRQVPVRHVWASTVWSTKDGELWRRHFDAISGDWRWDVDGPLQYAFDAQGRTGLYLDDRFRPIETIIALAWLHRAPETLAQVHIEEGMDIHLNHISWEDGESNAERGAIPGETWKPLKWKCGVVPAPPGYAISNTGRLRSPSDDVTHGFAFDGTFGWTRMAAIKNCGLVDLHLAAGLIEPIVDDMKLKPCIRDTLDAILSHERLTPADLSRYQGIKLDTAWSYFRQACVYVPKRTLKELGHTLVSRDLWRFLNRMLDREEPELTDKLTMLMARVQDELEDDGPFARRDWGMGELAFGRMCVLAQA